MLVAAASISVVPALVAQVFHRNGSDVLLPLAVFGIPTAVVVALFGLADRRAPLFGATAAALAYPTWAAATVDIAGTVASDAQGALAYLFVPMYGVPAAAIGGFVAWLGDVMLRQSPQQSSGPAGPYR